jgi:hypothetical protein
MEVQFPLIYNAIYNEVGPESRDRLKTHTNIDFEAIERSQDPARLIRALKLSHTLEVNGCKAVNELNSRMAYASMKQGDTESVEAFKIRILNSLQMQKELGVRAIDDKSQAQDFIEKLHPGYAGLKREIQRDDVTGKKAYPVSLSEAYLLALSYPVNRPQKVSGTVFSATEDCDSSDTKPVQKQKKGDKQKNEKSKSGNKQQKGDQSSADSSGSGSGSSKSKNTGHGAGKNSYVKCHFCQGAHYSSECEFRAFVQESVKAKQAEDKDFAHWADGTIHMVNGNDEIDEDLNNSICLASNSSNDEWSHSNIVSLDSGANVSGTNNPFLLTNVQAAAGRIRGIDKSKPPLVTQGTGMFLNEFKFAVSSSFDETVWSEGQILEAGWKIVHNQVTNDRTIISQCGKKYVFKFKDRKWKRDFSDEVASSILALHNSVETELFNEKMYTKQEVERARLAGIFIRRLGFPSVPMLIQMIERGVMNNCPVTADDILRCVKISDKAFISYLKGKTVHKSVVFDKPVTVPRLIDKEQILYVDILFVAGIAFLLSISKPMNLLIVTVLGKANGQRTAMTLQAALQQQLNVYSVYGFKVKRMHSDPESGLISQKPWLASIGIEHVANPEDVKVGIIENSIKRVKNTARCILHSVPYHLSLIMLVWLVCYSVHCLNYQISKTGREGLCARQELTGIRPDAKRDCRAGWGDYAQIFQKNSGNTMQAKTVGGIAVMPGPNGVWKFINLLTGRVCTRNQFKILPMPIEVVQYMNDWAGAKTALPDNISNDWSKYLEVQGEDDEGYEADSAFNRILERYRTASVNVDLPRVPAEVISVPVNNFTDRQVTDPVQNGNFLTGVSTAAGTMDSSDSGLVQMEVSADAEANIVDTGATAASDEIARVEGTVTDKLKFCSVASAKWVYGDDENYVPCIFQMSLSQSIAAHGNKAHLAAVEEIMQLHNKPMWVGVPLKFANKIPNHLKIHSRLFMKEKLNTNRELEKIKGRLVSRGDQVAPELREYLDSPTVSADIVFLMLSIFAMEERYWAGYDVPAAYTNAKRNPDSNPIFMVLNKDITSIIVENDPQFSQFVNGKGSSLVKVVRAAYGLSESSGLWFLEVSDFLKSIGFKENPIASCVFNKSIDGHQATILLYVDDMLIAHKSKEIVCGIMDEIDNKYGKGKRSEGKVMEFLGMRIEREDDGSVLVSMPKHIGDLLDGWKIDKTSEYPAGHNLFDINENSPRLSAELSAELHSAVASALFISKRGPRPDILLPINFLATRVTKSTEEDLSKFYKTLKYLNRTRDLVMRLVVGTDKTLVLYVDASYGVHDKGQSHTGSVLKFGNATIQFTSSKQKIVTKSSCEAELVGASNEAGQLLHNTDFLVHQGYEEFQDKPGLLMQDNQAAMRLEENGKSSSNRTKHISIRTFWIKDQVKLGKIKVVYTPTGDMLADMLTKPLQGNLFYKFRKQLMNER